MKSLLTQSLVVWVAFVPIAILNGVVRETIYTQYINTLFAHQLSTLTAALAFFAVSYGVLRHLIPGKNSYQLLSIGLLWISLTVLFDFGFGYFIDHRSWDVLRADYNIFTGRVWMLFLLFELLTPFFLKQVMRFKLLQ